MDFFFLKESNRVSRGSWSHSAALIPLQHCDSTGSHPQIFLKSWWEEAPLSSNCFTLALNALKTVYSRLADGLICYIDFIEHIQENSPVSMAGLIWSTQKHISLPPGTWLSMQKNSWYIGKGNLTGVED